MALTAAQLEVRITSSGANKVEGELKGLDQAIKASQAGFNSLASSAQDFGAKLLSSVSGVSKVLGTIGLTAFTAVFGRGAKAAWDQVDAVEQATVALRAYEKDASKVDRVLQDLVAHARSREGKLFMRQDLFAAAQALRVAGDATEDLTEHVKIMGRAVAVGMMSWQELIPIIQRVGSTGKLTGIDFEMLTKAGYQLDESVRNSTVTWQELFAILDKGIPADTMGAQADTIRGKLITLNTAIRGIGAAFLGIDADTSRFVDGGLGSKMVGGIDAAIDALNRFRPAAAMVGEGVTLILDSLQGLGMAFGMLPDWINTSVISVIGLITAFGMVRQAGALLQTGLRLIGLEKFAGSIAGLIGRMGPLGWALTAAAFAGGLLVKSFMDQKQAADDYRQSVSTLETTLESLRRQGDTALAARGEGLSKTFSGLKDEMDGFIESIRPDQVQYEMDRFLEEFGRLPDGAAEMAQARSMYEAEFKLIEDAFNDSVGRLQVSTEEMTALNLKLNEALQDPDINVDAWITWADGLLQAATNGDELRAAIDQILSRPLSDFSRHNAEAMDGLNQEMGKVVATAEDFAKAFPDIAAKMDDLRIDGKGGIANQIETLDKALQDLFKTPYTASSMDFEQGGFLPSIEAATKAASLSVDELESLGEAWDRIQSKMATGEFDNARIMADVLGILADVDLDPAEKVAAITDISNSLVEYKTSAFDAAEAIALLNEVAGTDSPLAQWNLTDRATEASALAENILNVRDSMDSAYRIIVGGTDAIGKQMQSLDDWATKLIGVQGEYAEIDDLYAEGRISLDQYNAAQQAQTTIMNANAEIQRDLLAIQAQQAPVLAQNAEAMQEYVRQLRDMNDGTREGARDQLAALALMDSATQDRLQGFIDLGGQLKEMGPAGAASLQTIVDGMVAMGDPMVAVLENLGLIQRELDGSYTVNIDGFEDANADIVNLTNSIDALTLALGGVPPVRIGVEGKDELDQTVADIENIPLQKQFELKVKMPGGAPDIGGFIGTVLGNNGIGSGGGLDVPVSFTVPEGAIPNLEGTIPPVKVPVMLDLGGMAAGSVAGAAQSALGQYQQSMKVSFTADTSDIEAKLAEVQSTTIDDKTVHILGDATIALAAVENVNAATVPDKTLHIMGDALFALSAVSNVNSATVADKTLTIFGDATMALAAIENVNSAAVYDKTMTIFGDASLALAAIDNVNAAVVQDKYMTIHVQQSGSLSAHAQGGFVRSDFQLVGEEGPELVSLPYGSYVHTAAETRGMLAGGNGGGGTFAPTINVTVNAQTNADPEQIAELAGQRTMTAIKHLVNDQFTGRGVGVQA